jgi:hypothetical protein
MNRKLIVMLVAAGLFAAGSAFAQSQGQCAGRGGKGPGYGGPPQSEAERAARRAECLEKNGGVCPNGGPNKDCQGPRVGQGRGQGQGQGHGWRKGLCDGTGPRAGKRQGAGQSQK